MNKGKKIVMCLTMGLGLFIMMHTTAWASFGWGAWYSASVHCDNGLNGLSKKAGESKDINVACTLEIKEIFAACRNKPGNSGKGQADHFQVDAQSITGIDIGSGFKISGKGTTTSHVNFEDDALLLALQEAGFDVGLVCPNDNNWNITFAVSRLNGAMELLNGAASPPNDFWIDAEGNEREFECQVTNVSLDPANPCAPNAAVDENGLPLPPATCTQEECLYFHALEFDYSVDPPVEIPSFVNGVQDTTDCAKPTADFSQEFYDCQCDYQIITRDNSISVHQPCQDKIDDAGEFIP